MKIAILWSKPSGYMNACLKELATEPDVELFASWIRPDEKQAPFDVSKFSWIENCHWSSGLPIFSSLMPALEEFEPDIIIITSWHIPAYRKIARIWRGRAVRVLCMDNQWLGTAKQWLGRIIARFYIRPLYDAVFLPGKRQQYFAEKLGFSPKEIKEGLYACDHDQFSKAYNSLISNDQLPKAFIYIGRLSSEKGIDVLVDAYAKYRNQTENPWPLIVVGTGPEEIRLRSIDGIDCRGFVQAEMLPDVIIEASCLILPSYFEPWALVVHEAVTAGLSVICSDAVGAADEFVVAGRNGKIFESGNIQQLADMIQNYANQSSEQRLSMAAESNRLSKKYTPDSWAKTILSLK